MIDFERYDDFIEEHTTPEDPLLKELYRQTHLRMMMPRMLSGHVQGRILKMLCHMINPMRILEIGTYTGYASICMARALHKDGILHTIEHNDEIEEFIRSFIDRSDVKDKIKLHIGDALEIISKLDEVFDLVFIDADKRQYPEYYEAVFDKLRPGGFIIADDIFWDGKIFEIPKENDLYTQKIIEFNERVKNDPRVENVVFPFRHGLMVLRKL